MRGEDGCCSLADELIDPWMWRQFYENLRKGSPKRRTPSLLAISNYLKYAFNYWLYGCEKVRIKNS